MALSPFMITPFTECRRFMDYELQKQPHSACAKIERRFNDCIDAYGVRIAGIKCKDLQEDFLECAFRKKVELRVKAMEAERKRQYSAGERQTKYDDPPPRDLYIWS